MTQHLWALCLGFVIDLVLGDPRGLWHPVIGIGRLISSLEKKIRPAMPRTERGELLGGALLVHDVNGSQFAGAGRAVEEFCRARGLLPTPLCDLHGTVLLRKP